MYFYTSYLRLSVVSSFLSSMIVCLYMYACICIRMLASSIPHSRDCSLTFCLIAPSQWLLKFLLQSEEFCTNVYAETAIDLLLLDFRKGAAGLF